LCVFFAMRSAFSIRERLGIRDEDQVEAAADNALVEFDHVDQVELPTHEAVQNGAQKFITSVTADNRAGMLSALEQMGVFALCPLPEKQLSRMELVAGGVVGRAQLIFLVELSLFAAELGDYERSSRYALEARAFGPSSWELYSLCVVEGLIALNIGRVDEAIQCLARSMSASQTDEYASLGCGVRAPNLVLAEELLERGERVEVLRHLLQCQDVWQFLKPQIDKWVGLIEDGEIPDFQESGILRAMNQPSYKLQMQWMRACSLGEGPGSAAPKPTIPKSPAEALAGRERLRAEYKVHHSAAIGNKIQYLDKELAASPDQPSPNPEDPSLPSSSDPAS